MRGCRLIQKQKQKRVLRIHMALTVHSITVHSYAWIRGTQERRQRSLSDSARGVQPLSHNPVNGDVSDVAS